MRVLRTSLYMRPGGAPTTVVVRDSDTRDTLESARITLGEENRQGLVIFDLFDMPDGDIESATLQGMRRQVANAEQEGHMAMLYWWTVMTWERVKAGGLIFMDKPTPLSRAEIETVFNQLAAREDYDHYSIVSHTSDGEQVAMRDGAVL